MSVVALPDLNVLPADALRALILAQHEQLISREREIEHLQLLLAKLHRMQFGRKSEKLERQIEQLELRLEELESKRSEQEPDAPAPVNAASTPTAAKPTRRTLPDHLPRQTRRHEPKETVCPQCQGELRKLGEDVSEMLEYVPASFVVIRQVRTKLSCTKCDCIVQAEAPSRPIARGSAGPGLLAHVLVSKYCDHLPLYRQSEIYARQDVELERSTLADWVGGSAHLLQPLVEALRRYVMAASKLHADDTPVPVLAPGQGKTKTGRLWTYVRDDRPAGDTASPAVWFAYSPDRKGEHPGRHLEKFRGTLQADAYAGFISSTKTVASSKPRAGRTCGASSTIWNKRMRRRWRGKHWCGSGHCTGSKNRFAAVRRSSAAKSAGRRPSHCSTLCASGSKRRCRSSRASRRRRRRFATRWCAGMRWFVTSKMDTSRSTTTPPNVRCAALR